MRRALAPRGRTPILRSWDRHDRISALSAAAVSPERRRLGLYVRLRPDDRNAHGEDTVAFLKQLRRHLRGPMTVRWDRSTIRDRSRVVRAYLADHPEIVTGPFPGYAPETNPAEGVWGYTKDGRRATFAPEDTAELRRVRLEELERLGGRPDLLAIFIPEAHPERGLPRGAGPPPWPPGGPRCPPVPRPFGGPDRGPGGAGDGPGGPHGSVRQFCPRTTGEVQPEGERVGRGLNS